MIAREFGRSSPVGPAHLGVWIKAGEAPPTREGAATVHAVRLTIEVTPEMRGHIGMAAVIHGIIAADMLRELLAREFPDTSGERT
ncbi:MAG TPA: hypothetical protein PLX43_07350 [Nitrobacter sp.]|nr:hypothetical protein [Nitrobacter sp.]